MRRHGMLLTLALIASCASQTTAQPDLDIQPEPATPEVVVEAPPLVEPEPEPVAVEVVDVEAMRLRDARAARPQQPSSGLPEPDADLVAAIERELSINLPNGSSAPVRHCLWAGPRMPDGERWDRCHRRVTLFAQYFQAAGAQNGVDPWVLAAMARRESGFSPLASGAAGEYGIMQLHPRGVGSRSRYVRNTRFRERCQRVPGACQEEVVALGAALLGRSLVQCETVESALGAYNTGRCGGNEAYTRRVLRTLERMRAPQQ